MEKNTLRYSGIVFLAGASYGAQATTVKITYAAGFTWTQVVASQALFAALLFAVALLVQRARGKRLVPLSLKQTIALLALGLNTCIGTVLYNYALTLLPVSVAITLLFQFTWMGIVVQLVVMRRRPRAAEVAAAAVILGGTLMASGMFSESVGALDPIGIACGLLSAVSCTFFMFFSTASGAACRPFSAGSSCAWARARWASRCAPTTSQAAFCRTASGSSASFWDYARCSCR